MGLILPRPYWFLHHAQFGLIYLERRLGTEDNLKMSENYWKKEWENAIEKTVISIEKHCLSFFIQTRVCLFFIEIGYLCLFGKACRMNLLELLSSRGEKFPVTTTKQGFHGSCWKITSIQMQRKSLTAFIREINPQYVPLMTYSNLTGLEWCTPLERATVVSF